MPLEAVCVVLDNSEYNRNGDFQPSRWINQTDAAHTISEVKLQQNPENTLAVMSQAGNRVELHITQSREPGDIGSAVSHININGKGNFMTAVKVAQLSLKHRKEKHAKPRIIIFCGHPLDEEQSEFEQLGKRLRQNNVAIDVISFAHQDNVPKLQALVESANKNDNSHFLDVPMGSDILAVLFTSPILQGDDAFGGAMGGGVGADGANGMVVDVAAGGAGADGGMNQFGVNFENDPELAQALRISMDEERARQNEEAKATTEATGTEAPAAGAGGGAMQVEDEDSHDEEYYIEQAKKLSLMEGAVPEESAQAEQPSNAGGAGAEPEQPVDIKDVVNTEFMKDLVKDMGLDIEQDGLGDLLGEEEKKEEEKKEEDGKDGDAAGK